MQERGLIQFSHYRNIKSSLRKFLCIPSQACSTLKIRQRWHEIRKISVLSLPTQRIYDCFESGREYQ